MAVSKINPMVYVPQYSYTDAPMPIVEDWDGETPMDTWKYRASRFLTIERARRNVMLRLVNAEGEPLYKLSGSGNLRRVFELRQRVKDAVKERDGHKCVRCDSTQNLEVDHVVRYADGGSNDMNNLRTLCKKCHDARKAVQ